jgi:hypothetical protein
VRHVKTESIQLDELWATVGIRQSRTTPEDELRGDFCTFFGMDRRTQLIISHLTGKRDYQNTNDFITDLLTAWFKSLVTAGSRRFRQSALICLTVSTLP